MIGIPESKWDSGEKEAYSSLIPQWFGLNSNDIIEDTSHTRGRLQIRSDFNSHLNWLYFKLQPGEYTYTNTSIDGMGYPFILVERSTDPYIVDYTKNITLLDANGNFEESIEQDDGTFVIVKKNSSSNPRTKIHFTIKAR